MNLIFDDTNPTLDTNYNTKPTSLDNDLDYSVNKQVIDHTQSQKSISNRKEDDALSNYSLDALGISESFTSTIFIPSHVIEINDLNIIVECLVDFETRELEIRKIEKDLIPIELQVKNKILCIQISKRPGKFATEFYDGKNLNFEKYFKSENESDFLFNAGSFIK